MIAAEQPQIVFHAAALKHVPMVEANPIEGVLTNVIGTRNVAEAARAFGVALVVMISTDKAVDPASVMGATKRLAESFCQALDLHEARRAPARRHPVRDGALRQRAGLDRLGGAAVHPPARRRRAADRDHPEVSRFFMTVREAVELVLEASAPSPDAAKGEARGKIFVLDMGEPVKIVDLARQMIRLAGLRPTRISRSPIPACARARNCTRRCSTPPSRRCRPRNPALRLAAPRTADYAVLARSIDELEEQARAGDGSAGPRSVAASGAGIPGRGPAGTGYYDARGRNGLTPARRTGYGAAGQKPLRRPGTRPMRPAR